MKIASTLCWISAVWLGLLAVPAKARTGSGIPHLRKQGTVTQFVVDGKPFVALTGEIEGDDATSLDNMKWMWPELVKMNLNTILPVVYWELFEPEEGKYDFTLVDGIIQEARRNHLRICEDASFMDGRWVAGRHLDHRVTTVDKDCWYCAPAVLPQGGYKRRDTHDENGILRVKLYRYE
jgi:hypothetical protein